MSRPLALTSGDPAGIGPDLIRWVGGATPLLADVVADQLLVTEETSASGEPDRVAQ